MPLLAGGGAIALWSFLALLSRAAAAMPPLQLAAMGFTVSAALGVGIVAARGRLAALRQRPLVWAHGVGGLFGYHALYFAALAWAPAAQANLLNYTWPLLTVLFAGLLLRMRLRPAHGLGVALALVGCAVLLSGSEGAVSAAAAPGYALALGAGVTWALYSVLARRLGAVPTEAVAGFCAAAAVLAAGSHFAFEPTIRPDGAAWLAALALGVGPMGAAFFLWDIGMKRGDPRLLGTLAYATPVVSTLLLGAAGFTPLTPRLLIAAVLVAAGGFVTVRVR
ncbi:MAG: EamA family transporter [Rhodospirillales bacterium]|nr:EamA family transporter [Rhodospirillales bacterium]MDE2574247.1 EamA family transporter [Rhodospirillales bacterium]